MKRLRLGDHSSYREYVLGIRGSFPMKRLAWKILPHEEVHHVSEKLVIYSTTIYSTFMEVSIPAMLCRVGVSQSRVPSEVSEGLAVSLTDLRDRLKKGTLVCGKNIHHTFQSKRNC